VEFKTKHLNLRSIRILKDKTFYIESISGATIKLDEKGCIALIGGENDYLIEKLIDMLDTHNSPDISERELKAIYMMLRNRYRHEPDSRELLYLDGLSKKLILKSKSQAQYAKLIKEKSVVFASGPAGTGKTHLAAALALNDLATRSIRKLILSRPVVEAGESLGFLPGDIKDKVDPYLRPLYDELLIWIDQFMLDRYMSSNMIEIAPLAYMRGRTFTDSWIILDEAQNTTIPQMKMFLTRLGLGSKIIVTGDASQTDLKPKIQSGFQDALKRLKHIEPIGFVQFKEHEIVRHAILQQILDAYSADSV